MRCGLRAMRTNVDFHLPDTPGRPLLVELAAGAPLSPLTLMNWRSSSLVIVAYCCFRLFLSSRPAD